MNNNIKTIDDLKNNYHYRWLDDPYLKIEDLKTYLKINIYDPDWNLVSQIITSFADLDRQKQQILTTLNHIRSVPSFQNDDHLLTLTKLSDPKVLEFGDLKAVFPDVQLAIKNLVNQADHFGLLELSNFYQINEQFLMISTQGANENVWKQRYKLKDHLSSTIDCSSQAAIERDLLKHAKKLAAIAQINKYFEFYQSELQQKLPNLLSKPNQSLVKKFYQNSKFATRVSAHDQIIVDHYYNDQLITNYQWLLNYDFTTNHFAITNEVLGMQVFHDQIINHLDQIKDLSQQKATKTKQKGL